MGGSNAAAQPNYADGGRQLKAGRLLASRKVPLLSSEQTLSIEISICLLCQMGPLGLIMLETISESSKEMSVECVIKNTELISFY